MKELKINNTNRVALIDDEDYERLNKFNWFVNSTDTCIQRNTTIGDVVRPHLRITIANEIMKDYVHLYDHKDRNFLNNCKDNIRKSSYSSNGANKEKYHIGGFSDYKGVSKRPSGKWRAQVKYNQRQICLGTFDDEIEAAHAYDKKALECWGEFAVLNFPVEAVL